MSLRKNKATSLWQEFKKFISKGSVLDMAVGVVIGSAFSAIVTSVVNILLSVCTWGVPGGLKGLITILPAASKNQEGIAGIGQSFTDIVTATIKFAESQGVTITASDAAYMQWQTALLSKYTLHGSKYVYNFAAIIDWGTLINAVISFLIIALTLFIIVKVVAYLTKKRAEAKAKADELYYQRHPEERPVPPEPGKPEPSTNELLTQIRDALVAKKAE